MKRLTFAQGTPEWAAHRATARNASEAPAVLGCSPYMTRSELLQARHTGLRAEPDAAMARRFADGHAIEAAQRPRAAMVVGEDLYPVTGCEVIDGIELSASFDGLTMDEEVGYECKSMNDDLRAALRHDQPSDNDARDLPKHYRVQMEQQLMVCGGLRVLFIAANKDGTDVRGCWYKPDAALRAEIIAGWRQFDADLAAYVPPASAPAAAVGHAPDTLPALRIEISGAVTASNLAEFKATALGAIRSVNRELTTDQHFADAEQAVKWCGEVESRIKSAKEHALSQTASIDALFKTLDDVSAEARKVRLDLEKLVDRRKVELKGELVAQAISAYDIHEAQCRQDAGGAWIMLSRPDFATAIKGKRNFESIRDALDLTLAKAKVTASEQASKIRANLAALDEESKGSEHLFRDRLAFIGLTPEVVRVMARQRITEHQAAEERRAAELAERERARIRAEEEARAQRLQQEREAAERRQREEQERQDAIARRAAEANAAGSAAMAAISEARQAEDLPAPLLDAMEQTASAIITDLAINRAADAAKPPAVIPMPQRAAASPPSLRLGQINIRLKHLKVTADDLEALGFPPAARDRAAVLYREDDFPRICAALIAQIQSAMQTREAA